MEFGDGFPRDVAGNNLGVDVRLPAIAKDKPVAHLVVEDLEFLVDISKSRTIKVLALMVVASEIAIDWIQDRFVALRILPRCVPSVPSVASRDESMSSRSRYDAQVILTAFHC